MKLDPSVNLPSEPVVLLNESSLFGDWQATVVERGALPHDDALRRERSPTRRANQACLPGASLPGIGKLTAVAGQIAGDVASVARRIGTAFDDQAARELRASIRNVADLSAPCAAVAQAHASDLDTLSMQLHSAVLTLNRTAASVEATARRLDSAATSPEVRQLVENFSVASTELRRTATQVRDLSARMATTEAQSADCVPHVGRLGTSQDQSRPGHAGVAAQRSVAVPANGLGAHRAACARRRHPRKPKELRVRSRCSDRPFDRSIKRLTSFRGFTDG